MSVYLRSSGVRHILSLRSRSAPLSSIRFASETPNVDDDGFRKLELYKKKEVRTRTRYEFKVDIPQDRYERMPTDQDWPSVWPVAASFKPSAVPLPVRQGYYEIGSSPRGKHGNLELMKIPNFLHLTPPAIERHCEALKKFCTKWPENLTDERAKDWTTTITCDYVHSGPSIRDERSRIVTLKLNLSALKLDEHGREKLLKLVGDRYNPKKDELTIVTDRCPTKAQNRDYAMYILTALYYESSTLEEWETLERQEADFTTFTFEGSRSEAKMNDFTSRCKTSDSASISKYGDALETLKNKGENTYNLDEYKQAVCKLMNLKAPQTQTSTAV